MRPMEAAKTGGQEGQEGRQEGKKAAKKVATKKKAAEESQKGRQEVHAKKSAEKIGEKSRQEKPRRRPPKRKRRPRSRSADRGRFASVSRESLRTKVRRLLLEARPCQAQRAPVDQKHRGGAGHHADDGDGVEPLVEQDIGHDGGHRRHQIEQARHRGRRRAPDQPVQQPDRADRQHHRQPDQRQHELLGPVHHIALEQPRAGAEENRRPPRTARDCRSASRCCRNSAAGTACPG